MKLSFSILALANIVAGKCLVDSIPDCAAPCLSSAITGVTKCSIRDTNCQCEPSNYQAIYTGALTCVVKACGADVTLGEVVPAAEAFCTSIGRPPFKAQQAAVANVSPGQKAFHMAVEALPLAANIEKRLPPRHYNNLYPRQAATTPSAASVQPVAFTSTSLAPLPTGAANAAAPGSFLAIVVAVVAVGI